MSAARITLLSRPGCHLCDVAREQVRRIAGDCGVGWQERDVLDDEDMQARWAEHVPVLLVDDRVIDFFRVDEARLRAALATPGDARRPPAGPSSGDRPLPLDPDAAPVDPFARARPARRLPRVAGQRLDVVAAVAVGGGAGALARYGVALVVPDRAFPWATFTVNVVGAGLLGVLLVLVAERWPPRRYLRPVLATGFCGAFTTYSTYAVGAARLAGTRPGLAAAYLLATLAVGLAATYAGLVAGRLLARLGRPR